MNQINKNDCVEVGYVQKPHSLKGEVVLIFDKESDKGLEEIELVLIEVDGGLVPFFIEEDGLRFRTDESAICRLKFIDSFTKAKELAGCKVFVFDNEFEDSDDQGATSSLIGMRAFDAKYGEIGLISRLDDFSGNLVITVDHKLAEIMIPLSDEIVTMIDEEKREIYLNCPDGLIEIYFE
jgi:16S rRNA processing protein RimM